MKKIIIIIGLLLLASSASTTDAWWDSSYQYRQVITLTGNTSGTQTDYQLMLNVSYDSNMQSTFDDLRFVDDSGNLQNAWLEKKTNDSWADIWVKFPSTPANSETQTYYMYYGKTGVSNYWNGDTTFNFFDTFKGTSLNTTKWNINAVNSIIYTIEDNKLKITDATKNAGDYWIYDNTDTGSQHQAKYGIIDNVTIEWKSELLVMTDGSDMSQTGLALVDTSNYIRAYLDHTDNDGTTINPLRECLYETTDTVETANNGEIKDFKIERNGTIVKYYIDNMLKVTGTLTGVPTTLAIACGASNDYNYTKVNLLDIKTHKYTNTPPTYEFGIIEEYTTPTPTPTPIPTPTPPPTPLPEITSSNYVIQNQTLYITKPCDLQYKITSNSFVYGGLRNINTVICGNNNTVISGWFKISTDKSYDCDYNFIINVNDTSYQSKIVTLKQQQIDSSIISKKYRRTCLIDGYEIYSYNTTVYIVSVLPNPIYFYFNLEDRIIQFGDKQFENQTLVFNQLNFNDQYNFMDNASSDTIAMKFKAINPSVKSGAELKGLTGILLNTLSKIPFVGKSFKNILYYPLFFIQTIFNFAFTFLDIIVNDWWYGLMLMEIVCIFSASRNKGYANVMEVYIDTHVKIIKFIYEWIILKTINLIITIIVTIKDMIKWW